MNPKTEEPKENQIDHWLELQFIGLDMFANTDEELKTFGMSDSVIAQFREWQLEVSKNTNEKES
ncbi:MAG: hypothetical protein AB9897_05830 [Anaerolineaceae bacterium]